MKLNRTREGWDHVWLEGGLFGYERDALEDIATLFAEVERLRGERDRLRKAVKDSTVHLIAAVSLLEAGGKKAAPSNRMFEVMLDDYRASIERGRQALGDTHD